MEESIEKDSNIIDTVENDMSEEIIEEVIEEPEVDLSVSQLKGVGAKTEEKLTNFGVTSLLDLCVRGAKEISEITGVAKDTAKSWIFMAHKLLEENGMIRKSDMPTKELLTYQLNHKRLKCGAKEVDELFGGGLTPEAVYEVYGEFGSGKTQFCMSVTAETLANNGRVIWIDCEDTFKPQRLVEILKSRELVADEDAAIETLDNIKYFHTPTTEQLTGTVDSLSKLMREEKTDLLVIDGSIGQFREEYLGRGTLAERQNEIARLMTHIKNISYYFRCTVIFTNQVQSDPAIMFGDPIKPIGGNIVAHASTYRTYFKKSGKNRIARMVDSPEHKQMDASFILDEKGISDKDEE